MANNFPNIRPTLNLDMVNGIYVDPRVTFTRAGTRTYFSRDMVKAEENLILQSQTFDDAAWTKTAVTISANSTSAPDGTTTADTVTGSAGTTLKAVFPAAANTGLASAVATFSVFAKEGTHRYIQISINGDATKYVNFDLNGSGATSAFGSGVTSSVTAAANGFIRCVVSLTGHANTSRFYVSLQDSLAAAREATTASTGDIFLWGAQTELRASVTAYTPTTTQQITNYNRLLKTAAANEWPREFDPVTGECLGRSVWEARTNLLTYSEDFSNAAWTKTNSTISANQIIAPDGTLTVDKLVPNAGATGVVERVVASLAAAAYTVTFFAKAAGLSVVRWRYSNSQEWLVEFNLSTLVITNVTGTPTATAIQSIGNGIYRCTVTVTTTATRSFDYRIQSAVSAGDGYSGIYIWGAQLELGSFAATYIPTVAAQVTSVADSALITGTNFSQWYNQAEGALFMQSTPATLDAGNGVTISDNTASNRIRLGSSTTEQGAVTVGGSAQVALDGGTPVINTLQSVAMSYKVNDFALSLGGGAVATDTVGTVPVVSQLAFATNEYIRRFTYYPQALTSANLQAVTA